MYRLLGAVLVVNSDSSRKGGPAIPLLHTLRRVSYYLNASFEAFFVVQAKSC